MFTLLATLATCATVIVVVILIQKNGIPTIHIEHKQLYDAPPVQIVEDPPAPSKEDRKEIETDIVEAINTFLYGNGSET